MNLIKDNLTFNFKFIITLFLVATLLYSIVFYLVGMSELSVISFLGIFIYFISLKAIDDNNYDRAFFLAHLHIVISSMLATTILGWDYGFYLIIIAIASTTYLNIFRKRIINYLLAGFDFIGFIVVYMISNVYFPKEPGDFSQIFYLSNLAFLLFLFNMIIYLFIKKLFCCNTNYFIRICFNFWIVNFCHLIGTTTCCNCNFINIAIKFY